MKEDMVAANTNPAAVTTPPVPAIARMVPVLSPRLQFLLESGDQQEVVVGPHRQEQHDGQWNDDPIQLDADYVLPHQYRQPERCAKRQRDGPHDDQRGDQASGDEDHDQQNEAHPDSAAISRSYLAPLLNVLVGRRCSGNVDFGVSQRGGLERVEMPRS